MYQEIILCHEYSEVESKYMLNKNKTWLFYQNKANKLFIT